jgi:hypothetical protein
MNVRNGNGAFRNGTSVKGKKLKIDRASAAIPPDYNYKKL